MVIWSFFFVIWSTQGFLKSRKNWLCKALERIESLKAEKRMKAGKADPTQTFGEGDKHKTESSNIVAEKLGIGSGEQYRKEKFISDNRSNLTPEDFADWDEGRLSTNKAELLYDNSRW